MRLVTDGSRGCVAGHDYLPFGEEIPGSWGRGAAPCYPAVDTQTDTTWKFGGQERDAENGFDNFPARHPGSSMGRFLSVDAGNAGAGLGNPQSWNGYGYVRNNPLRFIDSAGLCTQDAHGNLSDDSGNVNLPGNSVTVTDTAPQVPFDSSGFDDTDFLGAPSIETPAGTPAREGAGISRNKRRSFQAASARSYRMSTGESWADALLTVR